MNEIAGRIRDYVENNLDALVEFLSRLVATRSISGGEQAAVAMAAEQMRRFQFDEVLVDSIGNVAGRIGDGPRVLLYDAHIDTVEADASRWESDPFHAVVKNGCLYGRGACDDKGPFAALLFAGKAIKALGLERDFSIYVSGSISEEDCEGLALGAFLQEYQLTPECAVIAEPSSLQIARGHRGRALIEAHFPGTSVHASIHEQGDNPIEKALPFAAAVAELDRSMTAECELGKGDVTVTKMESASVSMNTVPSSCRVIVDRRMTTLDSRTSILEELRALPNADKAQIGIIQYREPSYNGYPKETEEYFPAWVMPADHPLLQSAIVGFKQMFERDPRITLWGFSSNGTYTMGRAGIPTIGFGPGDPQLAHSVSEHIEIRQLQEAVGFYPLLPTVLGDRS